MIDRRTIVVGDVHGCINELLELLNVLKWTKEDRVILDGDLVDRGPYSADVVALAQMCKFEVVMGNHDAKHVRYRKHKKAHEKDPSYRNPMRMWGHKLEVHNSLTDEQIGFLAKSPAFIRLTDDFIVVHGGLKNDYPERQEASTLYHLRYMDKTTGKSVSLMDDYSQPPNSVFWADVWEGPETVVYGHNVHWLDGSPYFTANDGKVMAIGIDTGACFGGHLTAFVLEPDGHWWYKSVKSKENCRTGPNAQKD